MPEYFHSRMAELTLKQFTDSLTEQEKVELSNLLASSQQKQKLFDNLSNGNYLLSEVTQYANGDENALWKRHRKKMSFKKSRIPIWQYASAAIVLFVLFAPAFYYYIIKKVPRTKQVSTLTNITKDSLQITNSIMKRKDMAAVLLDTVANGAIGIWNGMLIIKSDSGVFYPASSTSDLEFISTVADGNFQYRLPDGSKVRLSGISSVHISDNFNQADRSVEIVGTAYFDVAKQPSKPFRVKADGVTFEVLGTKFNVSYYSDEDIIKANLFDGMIRILTDNEEKAIYAGEQAMISKTRINGKDAIKIIQNAASGLDDLSIVLHKEGLTEALKQIAQCYGYAIRFENPVSERLIEATIPRKQSLTNTLNVASSKWKFRYKITGHTIIVNP